MKHKNIEGWCDFVNLYEEVAQSLKDGDIIVEIGCWLGQSSCCMCEMLEKYEKKVTFYCIDTWTGHVQGSHKGEPVQAKQFEENLKNQGFEEGIHFKMLIKDSTEAAELFEDESLAFCFIDDDHGWKKVEMNINAWLPKVKTGGILAGHDYPVPKLKEIVNKMLPSVEGVVSSTPNNPTLSSWKFKK